MKNNDTRYCRTCLRNSTVTLHRHYKTSGAYDYCWICSNCSGFVESKTGGLWIAKEIVHQVLGEDILKNLPEVTSNPMMKCEVCGVAGAEEHHWMPRAISPDDFHKWPTSYLCVKHHRDWHRLVTPKLVKR